MSLAPTTIVVLHPMGRDAREAADVAKALEDEHPGVVRVVVAARAADVDAATSAAADALLLWGPLRDEARALFLRASPRRLRWVHSLFAGIDAFLFPELVAAGPRVTMTLTRGVYGNSLAEWALLALLHFEKRVPRLLAQKGARRWERFPIREIAGRSMLVVGYGDIGRAVARKAAALGVRVVGHRRKGVAAAAAAEGDGVAERVVSGADALMEELPRADYVVLVLPLTAETRGMFGARQFAAMKPGALFVNIGRGATVDDAALLDALHTEGRLAGAALDVFAQEPLPPESPFWDEPNVLLSPHCADVVEDMWPPCIALIRENVRRFVRGEPLLYVADKEAGY